MNIIAVYHPGIYRNNPQRDSKPLCSCYEWSPCGTTVKQ